MKSPHTFRRQQRGNPFLRERIHDPYRAGAKLRESTYCPDCGVRYRNGRWMWPKGLTTTGFRAQLCPACQRIEDRYPAGELVLSGNFLEGHRDQILSRVLPHRIGHALKDAWGGDLKTHYDLEGYFTRVQWERNAALAWSVAAGGRSYRMGNIDRRYLAAHLGDEVPLPR